MAALHAGDLVLTKTEYKYLKDHPEDALAVIGVPGIIMETYRDDFEVLIDWSLLSDDHDHRGRDKWCIDEIVKVGSLGKRAQDVLYPDGEMLHEELFEELTAFLASQVDFSAYPYPGGEEALEERTEVLTWEWLTEIKGFSTEKAKEIIEAWEPSRTSQYHERKIPAGQLQIGDLFTHEGKDYVVTGIQQNGYIRSKPIPSGTVRWFAPHYKVRLIKTAQMIWKAVAPKVISQDELLRAEVELGGGLVERFGLKADDPSTFDDAVEALVAGEGYEKYGILPHEAINYEGPIRKLQERVGIVSPKYDPATGLPAKMAAPEIAVDIRDETRGAHHGQYDGVLIATDSATGEYRGHLDYAHLEEPGEEILIQWMEVPEAFRRQGIATQLVEKLKGANPGREITWGYTSEEGTALREVLGIAPVAKSKNWLHQLARRIEKRNLKEGGESLTAGSILGHLSKAVVEVREDITFIDMGKLDQILVERGWKVISRLIRIAPAWVEDEEIWAKAKKEVDRSKYDSEDSYYAVVTTVYKNMGGKVKKKEAQVSPDIEVGDEFWDKARGAPIKVVKIEGDEVTLNLSWSPEGIYVGDRGGTETISLDDLLAEIEGGEIVLSRSTVRVRVGTQKLLVEEIAETLEGQEIWTNQLSHGRDVVGVMDGRVWAQLPDTGLTDVTDQIDWNKLMNEAMLQEFGPGWEERLQEEFRVEGQREPSQEDRERFHRNWLDLTEGWGEEHGTGPEYWREKYPFEEFLKDHLKTLEELEIEGQIETERIKRHQRIIWRGGRTYIRTVTDIADWALGLRGAVIIGGTKYRVFHYHGDIWTASGTHYREIEGLASGVPEVKGQAGDVKLRQTVHKGGKKYIRTVTNIEFVERGDALRLRGVAIIDGIKYWVVHHHGDTWTGGSRVWDLKGLAPGLFGSLDPGNWDPRDLREAAADIGEAVRPYDGEKC